MDMQADIRPDEKHDLEEMNSVATRINILTEMLISLQARRRNGEITHSEYMYALNMIERLAQ